MVKGSKSTGIKSWPEDDRPREKLLKKGARALSNSELLAILLRTGTNGSSAIDLARKGKIPSFKAGGQWRFDVKEIEEWRKNQSSI